MLCQHLRQLLAPQACTQGEALQQVVLVLAAQQPSHRLKSNRSIFMLLAHLFRRFRRAKVPHHLVVPSQFASVAFCAFQYLGH